MDLSLLEFIITLFYYNSFIDKDKVIENQMIIFGCACTIWCTREITFNLRNAVEHFPANFCGDVLFITVLFKLNNGICPMITDDVNDQIQEFKSNWNDFNDNNNQAIYFDIHTSRFWFIVSWYNQSNLKRIVLILWNSLVLKAACSINFVILVNLK